jgi:hypothetical protein
VGLWFFNYRPIPEVRKVLVDVFHTFFERNRFSILSGCWPLSQRPPVARYPALWWRNDSRFTSQSNIEIPPCINAGLISTI